MADPYHHSLSSVKKWGGDTEDYIAIHRWFDGSKASWCDPRHRAMRHHAEGIADSIERFGGEITLSTGKKVPVRWIGEQHVLEDLGRIPTFKEWIMEMPSEGKPVPMWMIRPQKISKILEA